MSFTDEDLKRLKDGLAKTDYPYPIKALIARMKAGDKIAWLVKRFVERQGDAPDCRCDFCYALRKWEKAAGK